MLRDKAKVLFFRNKHLHRLFHRDKHAVNKVLFHDRVAVAKNIGHAFHDEQTAGEHPVAVAKGVFPKRT